MSRTLYWQRVICEPIALPDELRGVLSERWGDLQDRLRVSKRRAKGVVYYLEGLRDGGVDGAQALLDAMKKHTEIDIWVEN